LKGLTNAKKKNIKWKWEILLEIRFNGLSKLHLKTNDLGNELV